ncbi:MAG: hypothetical protein JWM34_350 [Ilumatobacteraceae bacterium]|nr:hypothetical protein [Ilumatobacteraceae bacterium]
MAEAVRHHDSSEGGRLDEAAVSLQFALVVADHFEGDDEEIGSGSFGAPLDHECS